MSNSDTWDASAEFSRLPEPYTESTTRASTSSTRSETAGLLTVVTPTYNSAKFLEPTAHSVLSLDTVAEWILVDNRSDDDTNKLIAAFASADRRVRGLVNAKNYGWPFPSQVRGLRLAGTKYVLFLDSDDVIADGDAVRQAIEFMEQNDRVRAAIMSIGYMTEDGQVYKTRRLPFVRYDRVVPGWVVRAIIYFYPIYPVKQSAIIFRRDLLLEVWEYIDIGLLLETADRTDIYLVERVGLHYRNRRNGHSNNRRLTSQNYWWWVLRARFPARHWWWWPFWAFLLSYKHVVGIFKTIYRRYSSNRI